MAPTCFAQNMNASFSPRYEGISLFVLSGVVDITKNVLAYLFILARFMESEVAVLRLWCYTSMPNYVRLKDFLRRGGKVTEPDRNFPLLWLLMILIFPKISTVNIVKLRKF